MLTGVLAQALLLMNWMKSKEKIINHPIIIQFYFPDFFVTKKIPSIILVMLTSVERASRVVDQSFPC